MSIFLETERLILKITSPSDFDNLVALRSDPLVMQYIGVGNIQTKEQVSQFLEMAFAYYKKTGLGFCSVFAKTNNVFIGQAGIFHIGYDETQEDIEIAYRFLPEFWGQGYATESAKALIYWGFENLPILKLIGLAHPNNIQSQQVLKKSGLQFEGIKKYYNTDILYFAIYKNDSIELVSYNPNWPNLAKIEINLLYSLFSSENLIDIQHVGSTAIPGMLAKPIIDIQIATHSLQDIKSIAIEKLKLQGYEFWYDNPDSERLFFVKGMPPFGDQRTHHVHIVEPSSKHWYEKIAFRDYLRAHPDVAVDYVKLKNELASLHKYDRERYTEAKTNFIRNILKKIS